MHNEFRGDERKKERKQFLLVGRLLEQRGLTLKREKERESEAVDENKSEKCYESGEAKVADNLEHQHHIILSYSILPF